ncbi:MAG TPA: hypothetical protein VD973_23670 [Symbiobacteriaceae bacterium]|jgi:hypothetical protein|nr:hypothetical protein [Symbiobacteriaceae bacterium]
MERPPRGSVGGAAARAAFGLLTSLGVTLLLTYHIYRNGRLTGLTVDPVHTPMWPGSPIDSAEMAPLLALGTLLADPDLALDGEESGGTSM